MKTISNLPLKPEVFATFPGHDRKPHQADRGSQGLVASLGDFGIGNSDSLYRSGHRMGLRQDANPRVSLAAADLSMRNSRHRSWDHSNDKRTLVIHSLDDGRSSWVGARPFSNPLKQGMFPCLTGHHNRQFQAADKSVCRA